jgi:hypothetical protein
MRGFAASSGLLCLLLSFWGCGVDEEIFARVGGHGLKVEEFQSYLAAVTSESWQDVDQRAATRVLDQFIDQEVVIAAAKGKREIVVPPVPGDRSSVVRSLIGDVCGSSPAISQEVLDRNVERQLAVHQPARALVRQLLVDDLELARQVHDRLAAGEDFVALSRELSQAPNAASGGHLGLLQHGTLAPELDEVIFALAAGEISAPVQGPSGYFHIFQVLEVVAEGPPERREVEERVRRELEEQQARGHIRECIDRLGVEVGVKLYPDHLWFPYEGRYSEVIDVP